MGAGRLVLEREGKNANDLSFNIETGRMFRQCADLLSQQDANPFRVNAYRRAAETLESLKTDARDILDRKGLAGLTALPAIGSGLASAINEVAQTGRLSRLDRLRGAADPEILLRTVPGIGRQLARQIHRQLQIETLEGLEVAAHDGTLARLRGMGPRRIAAVQASLASMLGRARGSRAGLRGIGMHAPLVEPGVDILLDVDREYREKAAANRLPRVRPRRFNPEGKAWLPVLHTSRDGWHFTALYSNTALAHELRRTHDWVVIYFHDADHREGQRTAVTETHGPRRGARVIRGRETEA